MKKLEKNIYKTIFKKSKLAMYLKSYKGPLKDTINSLIGWKKGEALASIFYVIEYDGEKCYKKSIKNK